MKSYTERKVNWKAVGLTLVTKSLSTKSLSTTKPRKFLCFVKFCALTIVLSGLVTSCGDGTSPCSRAQVRLDEFLKCLDNPYQCEMTLELHNELMELERWHARNCK